MWGTEIRWQLAKFEVIICLLLAEVEKGTEFILICQRLWKVLGFLVSYPAGLCFLGICMSRI